MEGHTEIDSNIEITASALVCADTYALTSSKLIVHSLAGIFIATALTAVWVVEVLGEITCCPTVTNILGPEPNLGRLVVSGLLTGRKLLR
jgi:hypothetical protein